MVKHTASSSAPIVDNTKVCDKTLRAFFMQRCQERDPRPPPSTEYMFYDGSPILKLKG